MRKILLVFGTRPEAIKMAPLVLELQKEDSIETFVCVTGQHRQMLDQVLSFFQITPDFDLDIMKDSQDLFDITSRVLLGMRHVFDEVKPDCVFVHGDTSTSFTVALAAFYRKIKVAHVEAGLRTYNLFNPWPEEANRQLTSRIASFHFAPTEVAKTNLLNEGCIDLNIFVTGNTVIDALFYVKQRIESSSVLRNSIECDIKSKGYDCSRIEEGRRCILITGHRRENFGLGLQNICRAIKTLSEEYPNVDFVYPMHLNPNVREPINLIFGDAKATNTFFIEPLDYLSFCYLMDKSFFVLTDSGGIQEEAPSLGKPVLVLRINTERPEAIESGTVKLVGTDCNSIIASARDLLINEESYLSMSQSVNPYGDGKSSERIVKLITKI